MKLALALMLPLAALVGGCDFVNQIGPSSCDRSAPDSELVGDAGAWKYTEGEVESGVYATSEPDGELLFFPGGMRYRIEHQLGVAPSWWQIYLSFGRYGTQDRNDDGIGDNTLAQATGNQAEVLEVSDTDIVVVNGSCSEYWLLLVAGTGTPPP